MANKTIIWTTSVGGRDFEHPSDSALPIQSRRIFNVPNAYYSRVDTTLEDVIADMFIAKDWAIPYVGSETNPKRPPVLRFSR